MDPYAIHMISKTSTVVDVSQLHEEMVAHMQDPFLEFRNVLVCTHRLLWSLPFVAPWHEFRLQCHDFIVTGDPRVDEEGFYLLRAWNIVTRELLVREELE